jgi:hydrogenase nickel incorporation protein HypA/HybF
MHELSVTENILDIAVRYARQNEAKRVTNLYLVIGRLASIVDDSVQFYWEIISRDTLCAGSTLHFERLPANLLCLDCSKEYTLNSDLTPCPACGSANVQVTTGEQFYLDSIEIET